MNEPWETVSEPTAGRRQTPFEEIYERFERRIYGFCLCYVRNPATAEDLAADVMVAAMRSYDSTEPEDVQAWLFKIARNVVTNDWRSRTRRGRILQLLGTAQTAELDVEQVALERREVAEVVAWMGRLKRTDRRIIALRAGGQLSIPEVAAVLGVPVNTAAASLRRAVQRLRKISEEYS